MDSKGRATDNIAIERFWRSAKYERIYLNEYNSIKELKDDVKGYMEFYNYYRFHQTLDYKRPSKRSDNPARRRTMEVYENEKYLNYIKRNEINNVISSDDVLLKVA